MQWAHHYQRFVEELAGLLDQRKTGADVPMAPASSEPVEARFLVMGGDGAPEIAGIKLDAQPGSPCAAIILASRVEPAELEEALALSPDPAVPIADFADNRWTRRDYTGKNLDQTGFEEMVKALSPIWLRLAELPFRSELEDREELTTLRLAYSRDTSILAAYTPETPLIVDYPLLGRSPGIRRQLELMADAELLRRRYFARTHLCGKCGSSRLNAYEACPGCGSGDLTEEVIVHHYRCGCQEPQSHFTKGELLICPKCNRVLRHFGVDYGKPGKIVLCHTCGAQNSQPVVHFCCLDCAAITPSEDAAAADWRHYDLTEEGMNALRTGRLPRFEIASLLERSSQAFAPREFRLLASHEMRRSKRYKRPFSVVKISFPNLQEIRHEAGTIAADTAFHTAVDAIVGALRASDFVGARGAVVAVIGFPETTTAEVNEIIDRVRKEIRETTNVPIKVAIDVAEGDEIALLLEEGN
jgi:GGDEF domain-containing protein